MHALRVSYIMLIHLGRILCLRWQFMSFRTTYLEEDTHGTIYGNGIGVFGGIKNIDNMHTKIGSMVSSIARLLGPFGH